MRKYLFTGVSGCGRIELLEELKNELQKRGKTVTIIDIGSLIFEAANEVGTLISPKKILDLDHDLLVAFRKNAIQKAINIMDKNNSDFILIGIHATFRWRGRIIDGINFGDLKDLGVETVFNVVDDVKNILEKNCNNKKYEDLPKPTPEETNYWIQEEELVSETLANIFGIPFYVIGRQSDIKNIADFFTSNKPRVYLSFPITAIQKENPQLLDQIQNQHLKELTNHFIVFNPMVIKDLEKKGEIEELTNEAAFGFSVRTVTRDYRFIDQSDFLVVIYLTEKASPGVLSEIIYASTHGKPVYMVYPFRKSPFLEEYTTKVFPDFPHMIKFLSSPEFKKINSRDSMDFGLFKPSH